LKFCILSSSGVAGERTKKPQTKNEMCKFFILFEVFHFVFIRGGRRANQENPKTNFVRF
jgi:hypothetical protein